MTEVRETTGWYGLEEDGTPIGYTPTDDEPRVHYLYVIGINQGTVSSFGRSYNGKFTMKEWADKRLTYTHYDKVVEIVPEEIYVFLEMDDNFSTTIGEVCWLMDKVALTQEQIDEIERIESVVVQTNADVEKTEVIFG